MTYGISKNSVVVRIAETGPRRHPELDNSEIYAQERICLIKDFFAN